MQYQKEGRSSKGKVQYQKQGAVPKKQVRGLTQCRCQKMTFGEKFKRFVTLAISSALTLTDRAACRQYWCGERKILKSLSNLNMKGQVHVSMQDGGLNHEAMYTGSYVYAGRGQHRDCLIVRLELQKAFYKGNVQPLNTMYWAKTSKVAMKISTAHCPEQKADNEMLQWFRDSVGELSRAQFPMPFAYFSTGLVNSEPKSVVICEAKGETGISLGNSLKEILQDPHRLATREVLVLVVRASSCAFELQKQMVNETGYWVQDMHIHNVLTIQETHLAGRQGLYNVFRFVDGRGLWEIGRYKWEKLRTLHELYTTFHMSEAWTRCSTTNAAVDQQ